MESLSAKKIPYLVILSVNNDVNIKSSVFRGGRYCCLTIDNRDIDHRLYCMYSGIYGPRSVFSECCPPLSVLFHVTQVTDVIIGNR